MIGRPTRHVRFRSPRYAASAALLMGACATSSGAAARSSSDTIVKVNGEAVPLSAYQQELDAVLSKKGAETSGASARRVVIRKVIRHTALKQQARARGIPIEGLSFEKLSEKIATSMGAEELEGLEGEAKVAKMKEILGRVYGASDVEYIVPTEQLPTEPSH